MSKQNIFSRLTFSIFALISYMIYLLGMMVFVLRLLDYAPFIKATTFGFQLGVTGSICLDIALVLLFGAPHSVMARPGFKKYCRRIVPLAIERSLYVFITSITLVVLSCLWQPIDFEIWNVKTSLGMYVAYSIFLIGAILAVVSTFLIDHFELFGLRQAWDFLRKTEPHSTEFVTPSLYKLVRHPMMFGIILALWGTPLMNLGHLILSIGMTLYIIIGTFFEERDLVRTFGEKYLQYKRAVPMFWPFLKLKQRIAKD
ncbi:methyltransferase family protein [Leptospira semungkisensis]|uniref:methyltransferase family protein n=1 Tax=Leptospira semungkisensis TaxID=2484985 RepID=UPI001FE7CD29|nr:isoprenylcysteine carboxylmethyltransferase family protein [Leptospira semungkisensis]